MNPRNWPAEAVHFRDLAELVPYAQNARTHTPEQIDQIAASMREWGWTCPILVDEQNTVIAGYARNEKRSGEPVAEVLGLFSHSDIVSDQPVSLTVPLNASRGVQGELTIPADSYFW